MIPFPEWVPDQPSLNSGLQTAKNCYFLGGGYRSLPTFSSVSSAFTGTPLGVGSFRNLATLPQTYVGTATKIYQRSGGTWTDVTNVTPYSIASTDRWEFAQYGDNAYAASQSAVLQQQTAGTGAFANVASGPKGNCIGRVNNFIFVGDVNDGTIIGNRVRWSAIGDPTNWPTPATSAAEAVQSGRQDLPQEDGTVRAIRGWEFGLVFQERAITRLTYVGTPIVFQFDKIDVRGTKWPGSVVQVGRRVYFLGDDGWYVTDGSGESQQIGKGRIDRWFFDNLNISSGSQISGAVDPVRGIILWAFPSVGGNGSNDMMLVYSYKEDKWTHSGYSADFLYLGYSPGYNLDNVDGVFSSVDATNISLDSPLWGNSNASLSGLSGSAVVQLEATSGTAVLELNDAVINEGRYSVVQAVKPFIDATTTVEVSGRKLYTDAVTYNGPYSANAATGRANCRVAGFIHRARFNITGNFYKASGYEFDAVAAGRQ